MHGTGCWLGMMMPHMLGGTAVTAREGAVSTPSSYGTSSSARVCSTLIIVGDAFAKPMLRALDEHPAVGTSRRCA